MNKQAILKNLATKGYNIGFGAQKHFATYNAYCTLPKWMSIVTTIIGIFQLLNVYKTGLSADSQEYVSATLIAVGIIALIIDAGSKNKDLYNERGKQLTLFFNELHAMYYQVKELPDDADFSKICTRMNEIEKEFQTISISDQLSFTHIYTNLRFFFCGPQIGWIDEQLNFKVKDKFPFFSYEAFILYSVMLYIAIKNAKYLLCPLCIIAGKISE